MVSFTCGTFIEVMKNNQFQKHTTRCRTRHVACLDCNVDFDIVAYNQHIKCITEEQKYHGSTYQPKVNKVSSLILTSWIFGKYIYIH